MRSIYYRAQFEHLTEILRSRTMDSDMSKPAVDNDKVDETTVPLPEKEIEISIPHEDRRTPPDTLAVWKLLCLSIAFSVCLIL